MTTLKETEKLTPRLTQRVRNEDILVAIALLAVMAVMLAARSTHYLLFHTMAELLAIVVGFSIFVLAWVSSPYLSNGYLIVLGGSYGAVALVDVLHTLTFKGMNLFPAVSTNHPTQFWLTARFLQALALLCAPFFITRKPNFHRVSVAFFALAVPACVAVMLQSFPAAFIDGFGLTPFKIYSEYLIIAMLMVALIALYRFKAHFEDRIFFLLASSLALAVFTEFCFTRYANVYDFANEIGHYSRFLSVAFAFMAIVVAGVRQPFELIFREAAQESRRVRESEARYRLLFDMSLDAIMLTVPDGRILEANPAACRMLQRTQDEICRLGRNGVVDLSDVHLKKALETRERTGKFGGEIVFVRKDGSKFLGEVSTSVFSDKDGNARTSMIIRDISERKRIEAALRDSEARMSAVFQASPMGIVISRLVDGKILDVNPAGLRLYDYTREQALGRTVGELGSYVYPEQRAKLLQLLREHGSVDGLLVDYRSHSGTVGVLEVSGRTIELQGETCLLSVLTDVTARTRIEAQIQDQAFHDALTQLPNRRLLANRLQQAMVAAKRTASYGALMFIDLDNFKPLNDTQGHELGDLLLIEVATRLKNCVREVDTVARVGGDEFVVMLSELDADRLKSTANAAAVAEKIRMAVAKPYLLPLQHQGRVDGTVEHHCTASIGIALFVNDQVSQDDILNRADLAMYQAKQAGRNSIQFYAPAA